MFKWQSTKRSERQKRTGHKRKGKKRKLRKKSLSTLSYVDKKYCKTIIETTNWSSNNEVFGNFSENIWGGGVTE